MNIGAFYFFDHLDSTNVWAWQNDRQVPFFCVAKHQHNGIGRRRTNQWQSHAGDMLVSYATEMPVLIPNLSVWVGFRLAQFFTNKGIPLRVKWPNDLILANDQLLDGASDLPNFSKVGGILIETKNYRNKNKLVLGLGLNFSPLHQQQGRKFISLACLQSSYQEVLSEVVRVLKHTCTFDTQNNSLPEELSEYDYLLHKDISFEINQNLEFSTPVWQKNLGERIVYCYQMQAKGISETGELIVYDVATQQTKKLHDACNIKIIT